jgi:hypothetical protein
MDGDTELPSPGDLVGGNIPADDEGSVLWCRCQLSCILVGFYTHECATMGNLQASTSRHAVETTTVAGIGIVVCYRVVGGIGTSYGWRVGSVRVCSRGRGV